MERTELGIWRHILWVNFKWIYKLKKYINTVFVYKLLKTVYTGEEESNLSILQIIGHVLKFMNMLVIYWSPFPTVRVSTMKKCSSQSISYLKVYMPTR